jgi:hypothetical protein
MRVQRKLKEVLQRDHDQNNHGNRDNCFPVVPPEATSLFYF